MKKTSFVTLMSFVFLTISSLVAYFLRYINSAEPKTFLIAGVVIIAVSGIISLFLETQIIPNSICFVLSGISLGCLIRAWYLLRGFDNSLLTMLLVSVACLVYLWIFFFIGSIPLFKKHQMIYFWIMLALTIVAYVLVILYTKTTFVSTFGFYMIIEAAFTFALLTGQDNSSLAETFRRITISTYSVLIVAIIVFIACISDGDIDLDIDVRKSSTSKPRRYSHNEIEMQRNAAILVESINSDMTSKALSAEEEMKKKKEKTEEKKTEEEIQ